RAANLIFPALLLATACGGPNTEDERLTVGLRPLFYSAAVQADSGLRVLQGSRACFTVETVHEADSSTVIAQGCHNVEITGKQVSEDNCVILEETGPLQVDFTPRSGCSFPFED